MASYGNTCIWIRRYDDNRLFTFDFRRVICNIFQMLRGFITVYSVIIFKYYLFIVNDNPSLWIEYCANDYDGCPECFEGNKGNEKWLENIILLSEMNTNLIFGRKIHRALWVHTNGEHKRVILKYRFKKYSENSIEKLRQSILSNLCSNYSDQFRTTFNHFGNDRTFWVYLIHNPELIIIKAIKNSNNLVLKNAIPMVFDYCGFVLIEEDTGTNTLINYYNHPLKQRIFLAQQLLKIATCFSYGIDGFRYLIFI